MPERRSMFTRPGPGPQAARVRRPIVAFVVVVFAVLIVSMDNSILFVTLKTLAQASPAGIGASQSQLQWAVDAYTLAYASLLLGSGVAGNRLGHRRLVLIGLAGFGLFSAGAAFSHDPGMLIACRAAMGAFASLIIPSTLAIVTYIFAGDARVRAIGIWSAVVGAALAIGPVVAGALLTRFWWGSVFLINVPVIAVALVAIPLLVPEFRQHQQRQLDPIGILLAIAGLVGVVFGVIRAGDDGDWLAAETLLPIAAGLLLLTAFALWERKVSQPALDVRYFAHRGFTVSGIALALLFFALFGTMFVMTLYLQAIRGYTALQAGLCVLPLAAAMIALAPRVPNLVTKLGTRAVASLGLLIVSAALLALATLDQTTPIWWFEIYLFVFGAGMSLVMPPMTARIVATMPQDEAGTSSAVNNIFRQVGGTLGIAVLGSALASSYRTQVAPILAVLPAEVQTQAASSITATQEALAAAGPQAAALIEQANSSFVSAMRLTWLIAAAATLTGSLIVSTIFPKEPKAPYPPAQEAETP